MTIHFLSMKTKLIRETHAVIPPYWMIHSWYDDKVQWSFNRDRARQAILREVFCKQLDIIVKPDPTYAPYLDEVI